MPRNYPHNDLLQAAERADLEACRAKLHALDYMLALVLCALAGVVLSLVV